MRPAPDLGIVFPLLRFYDIKIKSRGSGNGQRAFTGYTVFGDLLGGLLDIP
jgi:hypothetical protein